MLLGAIAKSIDMESIAQAAQAALGVTPDPPRSAGGQPTDGQQPPPAMATAAEADEIGAGQASPAAAQGAEDIRFGDDVAALNPAVIGRAVQILPLAICS
jgi:hypothetical protein